MSYLGASVAVTSHQTYPDAPEIPASAVAAGALVGALLERKRTFLSMTEEARPTKLRNDHFEIERSGALAKGGSEGETQLKFQWDLAWTSGVLDDLKAPKRKQVRKLSKAEMAKRVIKSLKAAGDDEGEADDDAAASDGEPSTRKGDGEGNEDDDDDVVVDEEDDEEEPVDYTDSYFDNGEEDEFNPTEDNDKDDY